MGDCLKRGAWTVCRFKGGGLGKKEGGGGIPQCTLWMEKLLKGKADPKKGDSVGKGGFWVFFLAWVL